MRTANHRARVVDQKATEVLLASVKLDISGQWEQSSIGGDDSRSHISTTTRRSAQAVGGDEHRHWLAGAEWSMHRLGPTFRRGTHDGALHTDRLRSDRMARRIGRRRLGGGMWARARRVVVPG